jgi:hypothetical protein
MTIQDTDSDGVRFGGFKITKVVSISSKNDESSGKFQIQLEAEKDEISTGSLVFDSLLSACNLHQESDTPIVLRMNVPTQYSSDK